jgi:ribosomal protein L19
MITVRKVSYNVGVEIVVPIFSPNIEKIEIVKRAKVRRSKLYYVRGRVSKALRFKFTDAPKLEEKKEVVKDEVGKTVEKEETTPVVEVSKE